MCSTGNWFKTQVAVNYKCWKINLLLLIMFFFSFLFFFFAKGLAGGGRKGFDRGLPQAHAPIFFPCAFSKIPTQMHCGAGGTAAVVTSHGVDSERVFSK